LILKGFKKLARSLQCYSHNKNNNAGQYNKNKT